MQEETENKQEEAEVKTGRVVRPVKDSAPAEPLVLTNDKPLTEDALQATLSDLKVQQALGNDKTGETEETVSVPVLDDATGRYKIEEMPLSRAAVITAGMMTESWESNPGSALDTSAYNQAFHYSWVSRDRAHPTTNDALQKRYRAHFVEKSAVEHSGHIIENVPGWGQCVTWGEMILVACPKAAAVGRQEAYEKIRAQQREKMSTASAEHIQNTLGDRVQATDAKTRIKDGSEATFGTYELGDGYRQAAAASIANAMEYNERLSDGGSRSYGGFQGREGFNSAIPDSPTIRRYEAIARAQSQLIEASR